MSQSSRYMKKRSSKPPRSRNAAVRKNMKQPVAFVISNGASCGLSSMQYSIIVLFGSSPLWNQWVPR